MQHEQLIRFPLLLSAVLLNVLPVMDTAAIVDYTIKAVIGGLVWLLFQLTANWIDRIRKKINPKGKEEDK